MHTSRGCPGMARARILRSPYDRERMLPALDGGDHIHPNDKGMQAMADAVDLRSLDCPDR